MKKGDTVSVEGLKVICVTTSSLIDGRLANYLLPFYKSSIPKSGKCFTNGSRYKKHLESNCVLTEKTYPFFARNN